MDMREIPIMSDGVEGSVTQWIGDLKAGGDTAAQRLWERYFDRLVRLAHSKLRAGRRPGDAEDEEDVALSAFDSFCRGAAAGRFPLLADRDDLWRLLVVLTVRKAIHQLERLNAAKRGGGKIIGEASLPGGQADESPLDRLIGNEPTPEFAAEVVEQYRRLREMLDDDMARQVLDLRLEGYSREEIAGRLGCAEKTVTRKLNLIRGIWLREGE
jgi:DNA-directed RNA polymerase specialized sigma24 family protein